MEGKGLVDIISRGTKKIWDKKVPGTHMKKLQTIIQDKYGLTFGSYWDFHEWSIKNYPQFWEEVWYYFKVIHSKPYTVPSRRTGEGILDIEWFPGARFNFAENNLRFRDDKLALIYVDEEGENEKKVTHAEMFKEVQLYAAAFKKQGLKKGDRVACYMSNRCEAIYAMLASISIGAIFGGPLPYYGAKAVSNFMKVMTPKFLITVDGFIFNKEEVDMLQRLPEIVNENTCIEKVIIVPTREDSKPRNISKVRSSCFLDEFLSSGRNPNGSVPEIVFEQLPFDHPIYFSFTSGTTGLPKGIVHSAGSLLFLLRDFGLHNNFDRTSVALDYNPVGWSVWNYNMASLALGASVFLYDGLPTSKHAFWDMVDHYKVTFSYFPTFYIDSFEKEGVVPYPECKLEHLKMIIIGGSPLKLQNVDFIRQKIKSDLFIGTSYGATELLSVFCGFDHNSPLYSCEVQCPALGMDVKVVDEEGKSVVGKDGSVVIATPTPSLPLCIWNDKNGARMHETYLSKYPGAFAPNDHAWIDPNTLGMIILGRSDSTLKQKGNRFLSEEIYWAIHDIEEIADYICVDQKNKGGDIRGVLFVKLKDGHALDMKMLDKIKKKIATDFNPWLVPDVILPVKDIPRNLNGKRMEGVVKKMINTNIIPEVSNILNPECLDEYCNVPQLLEF